jgi:hypothetical protein
MITNFKLGLFICLACFYNRTDFMLTAKDAKHAKKDAKSGFRYLRAADSDFELSTLNSEFLYQYPGMARFPPLLVQSTQ